MTSLYGWIISNGHLNSEKFLDYVDWFRNTADSHGIHIEEQTNDQLLVTNDPQSPILSVKNKNFSRLPDFIHFADKDLHLARQLEQLSIPLFNSASSIDICDNKSLMHQILYKKKIPTPKTILAPLIYKGVELENQQYLKAIQQTLGLPLIVKEARGSFGQQVYWIETEAELLQIAKRLTGIEHIYQQPIYTSIGVDLRLNVVGGQVVAAMKRTSQTDFRANVTAGGQTKAYSPTSEEIKLAIAAAKAVGTDFAGVDILLGESGPIVCEVNSNPHIRSIFECTGIDVAKPMIEFIKSSVSFNASLRHS